MKKKSFEEAHPEEILGKKQILFQTLTGLLFLSLFFFFCIYAWKEIKGSQLVDSAPKPLRKGFEFNERIFKTIYSPLSLAPEFDKKHAAKRVRVNGNLGLENASDTLNWKLKAIRSPGDTLFISMSDIKALPKTEIIFDFKCIEGWDQISHWGGVKLSTFLEHYKLGGQKNGSVFRYLGLITPDKGYYVGIDMPSAIHPQTLLCYEMNGKALPLNQGYPLRLICPVKYGIKSLKRIGTMYFSNDPPPDYWAEQGYDYYSGL